MYVTRAWYLHQQVGDGSWIFLVVFKSGREVLEYFGLG